MRHVIHVPIHDRVLVSLDGVPHRAFGPGRHVLWSLRRISEVRWDVRVPVFFAQPAERDALPREWWMDVVVEPRERAVVFIDERPHTFLGPGAHRVWRVDPSLRIERLSVDEPLPPLTRELEAILPKGEVVLATVRQSARGLKVVDGRVAEVLGPGRYAFWSHPDATVEIEIVDMRRTEVPVVSQELMTRDKVTLRLSLTAEMSVEDPVKATIEVASAKNAVYLAIQLAARGLVGSMTLDELLESRETVASRLLAEVADASRAFGVAVHLVGIKDVVLPGEMKTLLNKVIEAEKAAAANVILRREETAATRSLANTAKVLADNPVLLRMKELEAWKDIAGQIGEVRLVIGADKLDTLLPAQLLGRAGLLGAAEPSKGGSS